MLLNRFFAQQHIKMCEICVYRFDVFDLMLHMSMLRNIHNFAIAFENDNGMDGGAKTKPDKYVASHVFPQIYDFAHLEFGFSFSSLKGFLQIFVH